MAKYVDKKCEMCGMELIHVNTKQRFCQGCAKARQRERERKRKRGTHKDPLWREQVQVQETGDKERYKNKLQHLADGYRYGAPHLINEAAIRRIRAIGKKLGYAKEKIVDDIEKAKQEAEQGIKSYYATPEEIKEMLGGMTQGERQADYEEDMARLNMTIKVARQMFN